MKDALVVLAREMLDLASRDDVAAVALVIVLDDGTMSMRSATRAEAESAEATTIDAPEVDASEEDCAPRPHRDGRDDVHTRSGR